MSEQKRKRYGIRSEYRYISLRIRPGPGEEGRGGGSTPDQLKTDCAKMCPNLHFLVWECGGGGVVQTNIPEILG